nr:hypothetical protein [Halorubrum sp. Atlit-26R]
MLVEGIGTSLIEDVFESLIDSEATELTVVGYEVEQSMELTRLKPRLQGGEDANSSVSVLVTEGRGMSGRHPSFRLFSQ